MPLTLDPLPMAFGSSAMTTSPSSWIAGGGTTGADEAAAPPRFETGFALALETGLADEEVALVEMGLAFEAGLADFDGGAEAKEIVRGGCFLARTDDSHLGGMLC